MILVDFSSIIHRMIHASVFSIKPKKQNGKFITDDFIQMTKYLIFQELLSINQTHRQRFGEMVITLDQSGGGYWRRDVYPGYKAGRRKGRDESEINFAEVFEHINELTDQLIDNVPWKVVAVDKAEADDIILVLSREFSKMQDILIHSPDKDMIQAQRDTERVHQYSALTKKWLVPETKHDSMEHWILEHVCLGDASDEVPKVVDHTEFSDNFLKHIRDAGFNIKSPYEFKKADIPDADKRKILSSFTTQKKNRKGEDTGELDVYKDIRFGPTTLTKAIDKHGSLDNWLDSHPLYRKHFDRNFTLVMEEGIPTDIWNNIILSYKNAECNYNDKLFEEYLIQNNLKSIVMELPNHFKLNRSLTADDFGW